MINRGIDALGTFIQNDIETNIIIVNVINVNSAVNII